MMHTVAAKQFVNHDFVPFFVILFVEEQQELISKAKETIAAATEKCKDVENKMKVCLSCFSFILALGLLLNSPLSCRIQHLL